MKSRTQIAIAVLGLAGVLAAMGLSAAEVVEYLHVARGAVSDAVRDRIPVGVEIDRMELLLGQLQEQLGERGRQVAQAQIALEEAEACLARDRSQIDRLLAGMRSLRRLPTGTCGGRRIACRSLSDNDLRQALSHALAVYRTRSDAIGERELAIERQRQAYEALATQYAAEVRERDLLVHRLDALRSRFAALQARGGDSHEPRGPIELARASQLADQIEQSLRIAEKQQELEDDPLSQALNPRGASVDVDVKDHVEDEVDRLLEEESATASNR